MLYPILRACNYLLCVHPIFKITTYLHCSQHSCFAGAPTLSGTFCTFTVTLKCLNGASPSVRLFRAWRLSTPPPIQSSTCCSTRICLRASSRRPDATILPRTQLLWSLAYEKTTRLYYQLINYVYNGVYVYLCGFPTLLYHTKHGIIV